MALRALHKVVVSDFDILGVYAYKSTTESVTSSTTLQNDDELVIAMAASSKYAFEGVLFYDGSTAGDFKAAFTVPSGATISWSAAAPISGTAPPASYNSLAATASAGALNFACIASGTTQAMHFRGAVAVSTTSGNLQLQWAQVGSSATATRVFLRSHLKATKIS